MNKRYRLKTGKPLPDFDPDKTGLSAETQEESEAASSGGSAIKRLTFGGLLALLFLLLYIPSLLNWLSGNSISTDILRNGIIEESINTNALLVREEVPVKEPSFDGRYVAEIAEGEKTPAFSCIATVMNSKSDSLQAELGAVNARIVKAEMEKAEKTDFFSADLVKLDEEIGVEVQDLIAACNKMDFDGIGKSRHEVEQIVERKAEIIGENSTDKYIDSLKKQKQGIQNKLSQNTVQILSDVSGIVSYRIDGLEQALKPGNLKKLTLQEYDNALAASRKQRESDGMAHAGKPLAKIIKGSELYVVAAMKTDSLNAFKEGGKVELRFNGGNLETSGTISYIGKPLNGRSIVAVRTNRGVDVLSSVREVDVDIISKTEEGLKVPLSCLRKLSKENGKAEIMLIKANVATIRKVDIVCMDEEFAIIRTPEKEYIKTVNLYDTYILYPDRVTEGEIVQK